MSNKTNKNDSFLSYIWNEGKKTIVGTGKQFTNLAKDGIVTTAKVGWIIFSASIIILIPLQRATMIDYAFQQQIDQLNQNNEE